MHHDNKDDVSLPIESIGLSGESDWYFVWLQLSKKRKRNTYNTYQYTSLSKVPATLKILRHKLNLDSLIELNCLAKYLKAY